MPNQNLKARFISNWDEGVVISDCEVTPEGFVVNIETVDPQFNTMHLIDEEVEIVDSGNTYRVVTDEDEGDDPKLAGFVANEDQVIKGICFVDPADDSKVPPLLVANDIAPSTVYAFVESMCRTAWNGSAPLDLMATETCTVDGVYCFMAYVDYDIRSEKKEAIGEYYGLMARLNITPAITKEKSLDHFLGEHTILYSCPKCGSTSTLHVVVQKWALLVQDGPELQTDTDTAFDTSDEWDESSTMLCTGCNNQAQASEFKNKDGE